MGEVVELNMWESLVKFNERLTLFLLKVKDHSEVSDDDYDMVKPLCRDIWDGKVVFYKPLVGLTDEKVEQAGLFDNMSCENTSGTDIVPDEA